MVFFCACHTFLTLVAIFIMNLGDHKFYEDEEVPYISSCEVNNKNTF